MKKSIAIILSIFILLAVCGCTKKPSENSAITHTQSEPTIQNESNEYISEKSNAIEISTAANIVGGSYITEDNRYIVYSNPSDNYSLCRYDKQTEQIKVLFDENQNQFLHSIKIFNNEIYFVSRTEQDDKYPSLYKIDFEGENLVRIVENVGDDYILLDGVIYYTTMEDPVNYEWFTMYKYDLKTKESKLVHNYQSESLNYVDGKIYFVDYNFDGQSIYSGSGVLTALDVTTNEIETIDINPYNGFGAMYCFNEKLYYRAQNQSRESLLMCYDLKTGEQIELVNIKDLNVYDLPLDKISFGEFLVLDEDLIYFNLLYLNDDNKYTNKIVEYKDGKAQKYAEFDISGRLLWVNGNAVIFDISKQSDAKIHGAEYLNINRDSSAL